MTGPANPSTSAGPKRRVKRHLVEVRENPAGGFQAVCSCGWQAPLHSFRPTALFDAMVHNGG